MANFLNAIRSTFDDLMGVDDAPVPVLPDNVPDAIMPALESGVAAMLAYQGPVYAQLYLYRLKRYLGRREVGPDLFCEIARLLAERMVYYDPIHIAQRKLAQSSRSDASPPADEVCTLRLDELVSALPEIAADPALDALAWIGWLHKPVKLRFSAATPLRLRRLRAEAYCARWRLLSVRYAKERAWVERWLHMIDRSLTKQPDATHEVVQTATLVQGYGDAYRKGLADWHLIIDSLAKPVFDGTLQLADLAGALAEVRAVAASDPQGIALRKAVTNIRARASQAAA